MLLLHSWGEQKLNLNGKTKLYGLIGNPIAHSFSPFIQNKLANIFNLNLVYLPFKIFDVSVEKTFSALRQLNVYGVNITSPYKNLDLRYFCDADEIVKAIGSVNTVKNISGDFFAFNTDVYGVEKTFAIHNINPARKNILIFGAGGVAKSVLYALAKKNPATIFIANRTFENARRLANLFSHMFPKIIFTAIKLCEIYSLDKIYLIVQCTTLGLGKNINLSPVNDTGFFRNVDFAFDLIYSPCKTKFLMDAQKNSCKIINGFDMLIYQAVKSFEIWHNISVDENIVRDLFF